MFADSHSLLRDRRRTSDRAFTIIELLVVVAVLALLLTLRLSTLASAKDQTLRGQCAGHLHQLALVTAILANDNGDNLPFNSPEAGSPWDMTWVLGNTYTNYMPLQSIYCPASGMSSDDNNVLWNYLPGGHHITGYAMTLPGTGSVNSTNLNTTLTPQRIQVNSSLWLPAPTAAQRVLFADNTISASRILPPSPADNFIDIVGGFPKPARTSHMDGLLPAGGNLAMLDGHVEWRKFQLMAIQGGAPSAAYWWW